jgi:hypothetical protein
VDPLALPAGCACSSQHLHKLLSDACCGNLQIACTNSVLTAMQPLPGDLIVFLYGAAKQCAALLPLLQASRAPGMAAVLLYSSAKTMHRAGHAPGTLSLSLSLSYAAGAPTACCSSKSDSLIKTQTSVQCSKRHALQGSVASCSLAPLGAAVLRVRCSACTYVMMRVRRSASVSSPLDVLGTAIMQ